MIRRGVARYAKRTVLLHTKDGQSLRGVLDGVYVDCLVLVAAVDLETDTKLRGYAIVPRSNVSYLQAVEASNE